MSGRLALLVRAALALGLLACLAVSARADKQFDKSSGKAATSGASAEPSAEIPDVSGLEVKFFTPGGRDLDLMDQLASLALSISAAKVDQTAGTSNPAPNIKMAKDRGATGRKLKTWLEEQYGRTFDLQLTFSEGDDDVFINLGEKDPPGWVELWGEPAAGGDATGTATTSPAPAPSVAVDTSDFPDLAGFVVTIFTPDSRAFDGRDTALVGAFGDRGASVDPTPGAGGSNTDANVKVAKDRKQFGRRLEQILERTYGWNFEVQPTWDDGSKEVFINLGKDVTRLCGPAVSLKVGDQVLRGPDWKWEKQDGGPGHLGTVAEGIDSDGWVKVKWENGESNTYRWGAESKYDVIKAE